MVTFTTCLCELESCSHPKLAGGPRCSNPLYNPNESYCEDCKKNRPAAKVEEVKKKITEKVV